MKQVLIPTDFTVGSLQAVHAAVAGFPEERINILLLHMMEMPTGIGDLLMRTVKREPSHLISADFKKGCEIIRNKYGYRIASMDTIFRYGSTRNYVLNVLEAERIDAIALDAEYELTLPHTDSVAMVPLLRKTNYPILELPAGAKTRSLEHVSFGSLLLRENKTGTLLSGA